MNSTYLRRFIINSILPGCNVSICREFLPQTSSVVIAFFHLIFNTKLIPYYENTAYCMFKVYNLLRHWYKFFSNNAGPLETGKGLTEKSRTTNQFILVSLCYFKTFVRASAHRANGWPSLLVNKVVKKDQAVVKLKTHCPSWGKGVT